MQRLEDHDFRVIRVAAGQWSTEQDMHRAIAAALQFPDYYGHNLAAKPRVVWLCSNSASPSATATQALPRSGPTNTIA
ncbi:barstar family protein, partial [Streptomyces echinatus]|uniref:barstar family protein n=1 Tax=Streptomyces echinatus TaxID=67293 RepID=UPI0037AD2F75